MRVLAIDPGYDRLGVAVMEHENGKEVLLFSDCILTEKSLPFPDRLFEAGSAVELLLKKYTPDALAIETLFFNKNIKTAINVAEARGALLFIGKAAGCQIYEYGPQEIKIAVTGYGKSDKGAVIDMVQRLIPNAPLKARDDEYDAIAVGITALAHHRK